jgi:uncharacterized protein with NRDE domain
MCTIAILFHVAAEPLVIAANRDELYARPTRPPEVLGPSIVGGVDAQSGGTWLAVNRAGRFAAVTNQRALDTPPPGLRSRGLAVKELAAADDPDAYVRALDPRAYASMNLVWGDADRVSVAYLRQGTGEKTIDVLGRGVHVLCNDRLGCDDFPRGARLYDKVCAAMTAGGLWSEQEPLLRAALGDHTRLSLEDTPPTHLPPELARELTAICIHSPLYGTRSSTVLALDRGRVAEYLHADGPPCTTPFVSKLELLDAA